MVRKMVRTEYRDCNKCGRETSDGSMFDETYFLDEFYCTRKRPHNSKTLRLYYCGDCAEELDYECTSCGSPLKIGGTPFSSKRRIWLSPIITKEQSIFHGMEGEVSAVKWKYFIIEKDWFKDKHGVFHHKLTRKFAIDELDFGDDAKKAMMVLEGKLKLMR